MAWPAAPDALWVTAASAEGDTELNAFDNALLSAGIGNLNLIKVSSVIPRGARIIERPPAIPAGTLVPAVYSVHSSAVHGETISSTVGLGFSEDSFGMIFEHGSGSADSSERVVREMVAEAFDRRGMELADIVVRSAEHRVRHVGCTVAAVVLWWRELS
jgi:arginine decarboxylase